MKCFLCLTLFLFSLSLQGQTVLIDPGHGGDEAGAVGHLDKTRNVYEKDLALRLSLKIRDELKSKVQVFLTRSLDRTVSLSERAELAEKIKADLFISIHFNSSTDLKAHGFETYYLNNTKDAAVRKVEGKENIVLKGEELEVNQILIDLVIQQTVEKSKKLAGLVHHEVKRRISPLGVSDRGIKAGLFYVLALSKRPGLLLEIGFVSNQPELKKMNQEEFLKTYAKAVAKGILDYLKK